METSDDPISALFIGGAVTGSYALMQSMTAGGGGINLPSQTAARTQRAEPIRQVSTEAASDRRKKLLAGSMLTKDWDLSLGKPALLGVS